MLNSNYDETETIAEMLGISPAEFVESENDLIDFMVEEGYVRELSSSNISQRRVVPTNKLLKMYGIPRSERARLLKQFE